MGCNWNVRCCWDLINSEVGDPEARRGVLARHGLPPPGQALLRPGHKRMCVSHPPTQAVDVKDGLTLSSNRASVWLLLPPTSALCLESEDCLIVIHQGWGLLSPLESLKISPPSQALPLPSSRQSTKPGVWGIA